MNEFTKEELQQISEGLKADCTYNSTLLNKIQSMIINYCEHTPSDKYPNQFKWRLCSKCGEQYK